MAQRAVFLDRDNTIIQDKDGYLGDPAQVRLLPGAAAALAELRRLGFRIIVASNQSGVARGLFDEAAVEAVNQEMYRQLRAEAEAHIDASYYCPYHKEATVPEYRLDHNWRKPQPGMLKQAAEDFGLDLGQSWMIGDMATDIACGAAAGCRTILLRDPENPPPAIETNSLPITPSFVVQSLEEAARVIAREIGAAGEPEKMAVPAESANATGAAPAAAVAAATVAERLVARLERTLPKAESTKPVLDEILVQLRQMNRGQEVPEFSLGRLVAIVLQILVVVCLLVGVWDAASTMGMHADAAWVQLLRAGLWLVGAVVLQGMVLAIFVGKK